MKHRMFSKAEGNCFLDFYHYNIMLMSVIVLVIRILVGMNLTEPSAVVSVYMSTWGLQCILI